MAGTLRRFGILPLFLAFVFSVGCGGSGSSGSGGITIAISPTTASLAPDAAQQFTATVTNDSTNRGVVWSLTQNGISCAPGCGTVFPVVTASGEPTVYTAPPVAPSLAPGLTLTATAVANSKASDSVAIVVAGTISVFVTPATATIALSGPQGSVTQYFTGNAPNDTTSDGLTWGLTQNGTACSPGCGTIKPGINLSCGTVTPPPGGFCTANGGLAIYTAPTTAPSNGTVELTATDIAAPGESGFSIITLQTAVSITLSPTFANVPVNGTQTFKATLANDTTDKGVTWALSQNGASCSASACGSISPTSTLSGVATTYTAPASPTTVTLTATSVANSSITAFATIEVQPISVMVSPTSEILYANGTAQFIATVSNDAAEKGVTWLLTQNGAACTASCGTISPTSTAGGVATTYTAPTSISSALTVTLTATSVSDKTKSAAATISLYPPASVSLSPTTASVALGGRQTFTATVTNDPTQAGVGWSVTQGGSSCSPGCGTVSPSATAGNVSSSVYIAPASMPSSSSVTLVATSEAELTQSAKATISLTTSGTLAKFSGDYAFLYSGYDSAGPVVMAGSLTADGSGAVTGGTADVNRAAGVTTALPLAGSYTLAPSGTGSLTLTSGPQGAALGTFRFALNASGDKARFIEFDGSGTRGWGILERRSGTASAVALQGDYAFTATGANPGGFRFALAGRFHADGAGQISAGVLDESDGGSVSSEVPFAGSYTVSSTGRGNLTADTPDGPMRWAFYMISPGHIVLISIDSRFSSPVNAGEAQAQTASQSASAFTAASLDGTSVLSLAGTASNGVGSKVEAGVVTFDGAGGLEYRIDRNDGGDIGALAGSGSYTVEPDGRLTMWLAPDSAPLVSYLVAPNQGMIVGTGAGGSAGRLDAQAPGPFSEATLTGAYIIGTSAAPSTAATLETGELASKGLGRLAGTEDRAAPGEISASAESLQDLYSVAANGRVAMGAGNSIMYLISPSQAVVVDMKPGDAAGTISRIEK